MLCNSFEVTLILRPEAIFGGAISSELAVIIAGIAVIKKFRLRDWIGEMETAVAAMSQGPALLVMHLNEFDSGSRGTTHRAFASC